MAIDQAGRMAIGFLGGTFDPPHFGHLFLAECARAQFGLERVLFIPAGEPYRKTRATTPAPLRLEMTRLAVEGNPAFAVDDLEVRREGPTYTVDTLEELRARGEGEVVFIIGSDALGDMRNWKEPGRIEELARIVVAAKGHSEAKIHALATETGLRKTPPVVAMPPLAISGTEIRARVGAGLPVRYLLPEAVRAYVEREGLYLREGEGRRQEGGVARER